MHLFPMLDVPDSAVTTLKQRSGSSATVSTAMQTLHRPSKTSETQPGHTSQKKTYTNDQNQLLITNRNGILK